MWSRVPRGPKPTMTVLKTLNRNIPEAHTQCGMRQKACYAKVDEFGKEWDRWWKMHMEETGKGQTRLDIWNFNISMCLEGGMDLSGS